MFKIRKLRKTPYSRKHNIETYKIYKATGGTIDLTTEEWLIGTHAIVVSKRNIKVIKSLSKKSNVEIIAKIQDITHFDSTDFEEINNEIEWSKKLSGRTNFINYFNNFQCKDNINKYKKNLKNIHFCKNDGKNKVNIMLIEFIDGNMIKKGTKNNLFYNLTIKQYKSYITRAYLAIIQAYQDLDFLHNDLNDVNIMIRKTNEINQNYKINGETIQVKTFGFEPIIIDFGRSGKGYKNEKNIIDELFILTGTFNSSLMSDNLKNDKIRDIYRPFKNLIRRNKKKLTLKIFVEKLKIWIEEK